MEDSTQSTLIIENTNTTLLEKAVRTVPSFGANTPIEAKVILSYDGLVNPKYIKFEPIKTKRTAEYFGFCQSRGVVPSLRANYDHDAETGSFLPGKVEIVGKRWYYVPEEVMKAIDNSALPHQLCFTMQGPEALKMFIAEGKLLDLALSKGYTVQEGHLWLDQSVFDGAGTTRQSGLIMHPSSGLRSTGKLELTLTSEPSSKESTILDSSENKALVDWFSTLREYR